MNSLSLHYYKVISSNLCIFKIKQLSYYQTGFSDVTSPEQYTNGSYNAAYQQYIRRDFGTELQHCPGSGGFHYPAEHQSPLVITPTTGSNYSSIPPGSGDYYGTVYDVASSASSSSSASVYGDLTDQSHSKYCFFCYYKLSLVFRIYLFSSK